MAFFDLFFISQSFSGVDSGKLYVTSGSEELPNPSCVLVPETAKVEFSNLIEDLNR